MLLFHRNKKNKGFTLLELLVVISIIGLLATVVFISLSNAQAKTRDTKRRSDLRQIATALELYYDANGSYPITGFAYTWGICSVPPHGTNGPDGYIPDLAPAYIADLPVDPKPDIANKKCYMYLSNGTGYKVMAEGTTESICPVPNTDPMYEPRRAGCTFSVYTPDAETW